MINLVFDNLPTSQLALESVVAAGAPSSFYHNWGFLGAMVGVMLLGVGALRWLISERHEEVKAASLSLEQSASVLFIRLILDESKRVFQIADDHLPLALSQVRSSSPQPSRFDHFCKAIRSIPEGELDDRGRYTEVIREIFAGIISKNAESLLDAMSAAGRSSANPALNPTGVRFSLEADGYRRFAQISQFDSHNRRLTSWYNRVWTTSVIACWMALLSLLPCFIAVLPQEKWGHTVAVWSLWLATAFGGASGSAVVAAYLLRRMILVRSSNYGEPDDAKQFLDKRRQHAQDSD